MSVLIDTSTTRSFIGLPTPQHIARAARHKLELTASRQQFRFGVTAHSNLGNFEVLNPTRGVVMRVCPDVAKADVPFLLGLDALDHNRAQALTVDNLLQFIPLPGAAALPWSMPLSRNLGHVFYAITPVPPAARKLCQRAQLAKLYRSLYHLFSAKVYDLLKHADHGLTPIPQRARRDHSVIRSLPAIFASAYIFQGQSVRHAKFNRQLRMDLCFFTDRHEKRQPLLHIVDTVTHLQAASFLQGEDSESVRVAFLL